MRSEVEKPGIEELKEKGLRDRETPRAKSLSEKKKKMKARVAEVVREVQ